jgi:hypothetical protein
MNRAEKMIRITIAAAAAMLVGYAAGTALGTEVTTTAIKILPERNVNVRQLSYWEADTAVEQGQLMRWGNNAYWAVTAGTTTNTPPTFTLGTETNGTVVLAYITPGPRRGFVVQLHDAGQVWARAYAAPTANDGFMLSGNLAAWNEAGDGCPQGAIWVQSESGTNTVTSAEW